jgi:predicted nucleic acid-binding protein
MARIVLLDANILGDAANPGPSPTRDRLSQWIAGLLQSGTQIRIPEIADYEVRRELIRASKPRSIRRLDELKLALGYIEITTDTMLLAAEVWAHARQIGRPMADSKALDGDAILAAQAMLLGSQGHNVIVATKNVKHLGLFVNASRWEEISG